MAAPRSTSPSMRRHKRGLYTSFIQASVIGGFLLSVITVLVSNWLVSDPAANSLVWRLPFLISLVLLAVSLWVRLKLKESPVFQAMKLAGKTSRNPLRDSFRGGRQVKLIFVALFGIAAGLTVIWYTAQFQALYFLQNALRIDDTAARSMVGIAAGFSMFWFVLFGWLSDKIGQAADRRRLCADHRPDVPAVPLDGVGGQSRAGAGDGPQPGRRPGLGLQLQSLRPAAGNSRAAARSTP